MFISNLYPKICGVAMYSSPVTIQPIRSAWRSHRANLALRGKDS